MKKLLLMGMLCLGANYAEAQHSTIKINNTTACTVNIELYGDISGSGCSPASYSTTMLAVAPGVFVYDPSSVPGGMNCFSCSPASLSSTDLFWHAVVYKSIGVMCPAGFFPISQTTCYPNNSNTYATYDANCTQCVPDVTVKWTDMGTYIMLDVY